jgi:gamma-glutamyl AIG2-like cyclotransferase
MARPGEPEAALFSYGTLQQPQVQLATFGRRLHGRPDALAGYRLAPLAITDPGVVATSGAAIHTIARPTGDPRDVIAGVVFALTAAEIEAADAYETDAYARIEAELVSGARAFVYVGPPWREEHG